MNRAALLAVAYIGQCNETIRQLRELCAAVYQVVGAVDGPVEMLNNLSAAACGQALPHDPGAGLPWTPDCVVPCPDPGHPLPKSKSRLYNSDISVAAVSGSAEHHSLRNQ